MVRDCDLFEGRGGSESDGGGRKNHGGGVRGRGKFAAVEAVAEALAVLVFGLLMGGWMNGAVK